MTGAATDLTDLYRNVVLEHSRRPRNAHRPAAFDREAEGHNPLCGDKVRVYVSIAGERLQGVACEASGCAICVASASLMTEAALARPLGAVRTAIDTFLGALTTGQPALTGDLAALGSVSRFPSRIRCATLPWKTLQAALDPAPGGPQGTPVTTTELPANDESTFP